MFEGHFHQIVNGARHSIRHARIAVLGLGLTFGGGGLAAAEQTASSAPASSSAPSEDGISAARRDFEAVKSARNPALQPKSDLPRIAVPDLPAAPAVGPIAPKQLKGTEKKSANWLLDAMEKQKPRKDAERGERRERTDNAERELTLDGQADDRATSADEKTPERANNDAQSRKQNAEPENPLAHYLGEWMTPQDYALLKPGIEQSLSQSGQPANNPANSPLSVGNLPGGDAIFGSAVSSGVASAIGGTPRENPYLDGLKLAPAMALPAPSGVLATPPPPATISSQPTFAPPPPVAPAKPKIPDFAKPAQDEKYFKQLKRF